MTQPLVQPGPARRLGRSIAALVAGFVVAVVLSLATDLGLHAAGLAPAPSQRWSTNLLLIATVYRTLYGILSSYIVARLAPYRPMLHSFIGGAIGLLLSIAGAIATWNAGLGPHWYPVALIVGALPSAWIGGKLRLMQLKDPEVKQ